MIVKHKTASDSRSYFISLSPKGKKSVSETENFADPIRKQVLNLTQNEQESMVQTISSLIFKLNTDGVLSVQRTCYGCRFYDKTNTGHYCNLIQTTLKDQDIRLDCPEYEEKA